MSKKKRFAVVYGSTLLDTKQKAIAAAKKAVAGNAQYATHGYYVLELKAHVTAQKPPSPPQPKVTVKEF